MHRAPQSGKLMEMSPVGDPMLLIGSQPQKNRTRRALLQVGACTLLGLSGADRLRLHAEAPSSYLQGKAKSVILLWLWGGPAQLDTWDPKPNAPLDYRGPFSSIPTRTAGVRIGELFPQIARLSEQYSIIRSLHTSSNDHGIAGTIGLTGSNAGAQGLGGQPLSGAPRPALGAVVSRQLGERNTTPPYMIVGGKLHQGKKQVTGEGGGTLGGKYDPFRLEYDPVKGVRIPGLQLAEQLTPERLTDRRTLLDALARAERQIQQHHGDAYYSQAIALLTSPDARKMFDLSQEKPQTKQQYGYTRFGQSCLLARRLVEHGVPFVQVNWSDHVEAEEDSGDGGWDHHYRNFQIMQDRHAAWLDQAYAALLTDLAHRGLLDQTLILAVGEFGRTPRINEKAGRDHWEHCYSALIAGGGIRGGRVIGESDAKAERPILKPLTPADLAATIHHQVGISSEQAALLGLQLNGTVIQELL
ncbi:MAG: DUF1501 domain-containing protein [Zavarzinella sp.]